MNDKKKTAITIHSSAAEYLTFDAATGDNADSVEMRYQDENIWLTQKMMAALYDVSVQNVGQHIKKIFDDGELSPDSVIKKYFITAADGKDYDTKHYNLQMIIAVGFKVNNERAVRFRKWAGQIVKDYTIQGRTMDADRLARGKYPTSKPSSMQKPSMRNTVLCRTGFLHRISISCLNTSGREFFSYVSAVSAPCAASPAERPHPPARAEYGMIKEMILGGETHDKIAISQ
ncbi:hypothetical protein AGMMS49983_04420 [Clostridia bacterium]|nr:hypothetical protein AGMMS49983_04420 [Clostridia bacterium]